jgi:hypothetical protein
MKAVPVEIYDICNHGQYTQSVVYVAGVQLQLMPDVEREQPLLCLLTRGNYKVEDERVQSGGLRTQQGCE